MEANLYQKCVIDTKIGLIELKYYENDFKIFFPDDVNDEAIKYLILYDQENDVVTVDYSAPLDYKILAVLHEYICQGRKFEEFANIHGDDSELRCCMIESYILHDPMIIQRFDVAEYVRARMLMFNFLIKHNLNPEMNLMFRKSLSFLESYFDLF